LSFNRSLGVGALLWLLLGLILGVFGAAMHVLPKKLCSQIRTVVLSVLAVSVLETFLTDLLEGFGLEALTDFVYYKRGGLEVGGALLVAALALIIPLLVGTKVLMT
jgi:hypothetical protein